jgi:hypothetical protein
MVAFSADSLNCMQAGCLAAALIAAAGAAHAASEKVMYSFEGCNDGAGPPARLINVGGTLYGTTDGFRTIPMSASGYGPGSPNFPPRRLKWNTTRIRFLCMMRT